MTVWDEKPDPNDVRNGSLPVDYWYPKTKMDAWLEKVRAEYEAMDAQINLLKIDVESLDKENRILKHRGQNIIPICST